MKLGVRIWLMLIVLMVLAIGASAFSPRLFNQMLGWSCGQTNALYTYDAKGNRQDQFIIVNGTTDATNYEYDEDNRLISVTVRDTEQPKVFSFAYDYRTRRIARETPTEKTIHVFDGGLSVQEYDVSATSSLTPNNLTTESIRGEGMGGGVGGMVYSVRNGQLEASHSNQRGDVVSRTDNAGNLTWFARYNAYGTRFDEVGATYDRQRGNTKDEEEPLGLSNQNLRYLDIEHGVWLTLDPAGHDDGPNLYRYLHSNPINAFDPLGLDEIRFGLQFQPENFARAMQGIKQGAINFGNVLRPGSYYDAFVDTKTSIQQHGVKATVDNIKENINAKLDTPEGVMELYTEGALGFATGTLLKNAAGAGSTIGKLDAALPNEVMDDAATLSQTSRQTGAYSQLKAAKVADAHHPIQDAAVRELPGYKKGDAPAIQLDGPPTKVGSPHYKATQTQRQAGGGTYGAERRIGYKAMRKAEVSKDQSRSVIEQADKYFESLGVDKSTKTRIPGNRKKE